MRLLRRIVWFLVTDPSLRFLALAALLGRLCR